MSRAFPLSIGLPIRITFFLAFFCLPQLVLANVSPAFTHLQVDLGLEAVGELDFQDDGITVEKGRFLTYQIEVENTGNYTMEKVRILMEPPDYMDYVAESTFLSYSNEPNETQLVDVAQEMSPLALGYEIESLPPQKVATFTLQYQVWLNIQEDPAYTLAWAHGWSPYSIIPVVSDPVETTISGEPTPLIQVEITPSPPEGQAVNSGFFIEYIYSLHNVSGLSINEVSLATFLPDYTQCIEGCDVGHIIGDLEPNAMAETQMSVQVAQDTQGANHITHIGYDLFGQTMEDLEFREDLLHPLDGQLTDDGEFVVMIDQVPDFILNAHDENSLREDLANQTETTYLLDYSGRHRTYTYPSITPGNPKVTYDCKVYQHPYPPNAQFYAYNSHGGNCEHLNECPISSDPIVFETTTNLPELAPKLFFGAESQDLVQNKPFVYSGPNGNVNAYVKNGGQVTLPDDFTLSRAVNNGLAGVVDALVTTTIQEDNWQYKKTGQKEEIGECSCGEDCDYTVYRDIYHWEKVSSTPFTLTDDDETDISVYTSTAWLKTQGGHVGTNSSFTHGNQTLANYLPLGASPMISPNHFTPSWEYSPIGEFNPGEFNAEYMVFAGQDVGSLRQMKQDEDPDWVQTGVEFPFLQQGDLYDRQVNARDYTQDLLDRQLYAPVEKQTLTSPLIGTVDLGDDVVIHHEGDLVLGEENSADPLYLTGGQVRLYVEGDVYIYTDVYYQAEGITDYHNTPVVRIDASTIYIDGAVEKVELMMLARESFYSGESHRRLTIVGDVIAKNTFWQRKPLLQFEPESFNQPSEYVIEDLRKYVIPAPGDTQLPYDHTIWRQVNPATGEVWDSY